MKVGSASRQRWALTAVYASPQSSIQKYLWKKFDALKVDLPWVLIGKFNYVLKEEERCSNSSSSDGNGLIDLGFIETRFTWPHRVSVEIRRAARLDRALCCAELRRLFPGDTIRHLNNTYFDHCPVLLDLNGVWRQDGGETIQVLSLLDAA